MCITVGAGKCASYVKVNVIKSALRACLSQQRRLGIPSNFDLLTLEAASDLPGNISSQAGSDKSCCDKMTRHMGTRMAYLMEPLKK